MQLHLQSNFNSFDGTSKSENSKFRKLKQNWILLPRGRASIWNLTFIQKDGAPLFRTTDQFIRRHIMLPFPSLEQLLQRIKGKTRFSKIKKLSNWVVEIRI